VIDTCIHHRWAAESELHPYLDPAWAELVGNAGSLPLGTGARRLIPSVRYSNPAGDEMPEARLPDGRPAGSSLETLVAQALEPVATERAILMFERGMFAPAALDPYLAEATTRAINDWSIDRWAGQDDRLYGAALVPTQTPDRAAAEIRRIGAHPKIAAVLLAANGAGKLFGHPLYHPIFEAASELDLPVVIHRGGEAITETGLTSPGGLPLTFAEHAALSPTALISHTVSLLAAGVFMRYPRLRVCLAGSGVAWVGGLLRRLELSWRANRRNVPWVQEPPAVYFRRHFRISTYGIEDGADPEFLGRLIAMTPGLERILCYGSGYPAWDTCGADTVRALVPEAWHARVFDENAREWFRWPGQQLELEAPAVEAGVAL